MFRIMSLNGYSVTPGKWKVEINPSASTNMFTAGDDVAAKVTAAKREISKAGGTVTDESGHWSGSGVDLLFTAPSGFSWPFSWGLFTKDQTYAERMAAPVLDDAERRAEQQRQAAMTDAEALADRQRAAAIRDAEALAERQRAAAMRDAARLADSQRAAAEQQGRHLMEDADKRAGARITQARDMAMWGGIILVTFGTVAYIAVSD